MTENIYWNLLAKKLAGEATNEELEELELLIKTQPELVYSAEIINNLWSLPAKEGSTYDAELSFEVHLENLRKQSVHLDHLQTPAFIGLEESFQPGNKKLKKFLYVFAIVVCISALAFFFWPQSPKTVLVAEKTYSEVSTSPGSITKLILPDSSVVWLNAGSKLTYNEQFGVKNRNATLSGEAYFDVKKSTIPFYITANGLHIKVLGTAFNVKSYPGEKTTETSLIRGKVEVTHDKRPGEIFILKPNEKLVIANENELEKKVEDIRKSEPRILLSSLTHTFDNNIIETSWVENKLIFQDETFEEVARKMERKYNVKIEIKDPALSQLRLGGGPFENETIQQALVALQIAFQFNFTVTGNAITITR